jgi:GTPase
VIVGDHKRIILPQIEKGRIGLGRLKGLRYLHTHLKNERLLADDLADLSIYNFDYISAAESLEDGSPGLVHSAYLLPPDENGKIAYKKLESLQYANLENNFLEFIANLENEFSRKLQVKSIRSDFERGILVAISLRNDEYFEDAMMETEELARTCKVMIIDRFIQQRKEPDPKYLIGRGKLDELMVRATQIDADILIFSQDLNPGLARRISDITGLKIIDRTQLILDVFSLRAKSQDGKIQVELAQLKYTLPRLVEMDTMMSRLTGGIGGRGPGETKLEINRRRAEERIHRLEKDIESLARKRFQKRNLRKRSNIPIVSIVGYTNAGKSTLLNTLTKSSVIVEDKPFSTLDPASRRLRFPREREIVVTDTVGFIRDLPKDLLNAFRATLEEIGDADLILHVVDISNKNFRAHIEAVETILKQLNFHAIPQILVVNKIDRLEKLASAKTSEALKAIPISALDSSSLGPLMQAMEKTLWPTASEPTAY